MSCNSDEGRIDSSQSSKSDSAEVFEDVSSDVEPVIIQDCFCPECERTNGVTHLLLTVIPHFREIIIMSFQCPDCNLRNSEVQFGGKFALQGVVVRLDVRTNKDLSRQLVRSESCLVHIPEIDLEVPAGGKSRGLLTTVEGFLTSVADDLDVLQPERRESTPDIAEKIDSVINQLRLFALDPVEHPFTIVLDDPAGNSYIQNLCLPRPDPQLHVERYERSVEQCLSLGISIPSHYNSTESSESGSSSRSQLHSFADVAAAKMLSDYYEAQVQVETKSNHLIDPNRAGSSSAVDACNIKNIRGDFSHLEEISSPEDMIIFPDVCPMCSTPGEIRMMLTNIPYFKEIVLMSFRCDDCGYRSTEIKSGSITSVHGRRITLHVTCVDDLSRDILKSDTARVIIPEIDLTIETGTLGGMFTTIEGLLRSVHEQLAPSVGRFEIGDSATDEDRARFRDFLDQLMACAIGERLNFHIILDDPVSNSHLQNLFAPDPDPEMTIEEYQRTPEQDDELGIHPSFYDETPIAAKASVPTDVQQTDSESS